MAGPDVTALAADLARAVELTMSSSASQGDRLKAYNACESFKETSPLCAEAGLFLAANKQHSLISRHFGLQLMEHTVKYRWTQISQQEKLFIKENAMKLLAAGGIGEEPHMKDALSRVVVEMVKREWPQQWPGLLSELSDACACGETQTELVLLVFLRLVEDVAVLQTLESNQRRKDIYQALTTNMAVIFDFFLRLIELHVNQFQSCESNSPKANSHGRVVQVVLLTLTGFVEWVSMCHIMAHEGRLLHILCFLLDSVFQCASAECLLQIVQRKGKIDERKPLLILFSEQPAQCLLRATNTKIVSSDEQHYLFKKKLIQVLTGLGSQLCALWGKESMGRPPNFSLFLDAILSFSNHPSLTLAHFANPLWNSMLKHDHISRDSIFLSYIPRWVQCTAPKLVKVIFPNGKTASSSSDVLGYIKLDFDSEEEYSLYFYRCRSDFLDTFRQATIVAPLVTFAYVEQWLIKQLQMPNTIYGLGIADPLIQEWDALSACLESVLSRVLQAQERPSVASGLSLLQMCLAYHPVDPLILSTLLTCISALFVFLSMSSGQMAPAISSVATSGVALLPQVLDKIFQALVYSPSGQTKDNRSRAVKNVRRHAASLMVKIGNKYPLLLLPVFDQIRATVINLSRPDAPAQLSVLERVTLQESLLLISNHFCDYDRQSSFVNEVMAEANSQWLMIVNVCAFKNAVDFLTFVGLDKPPVPAGIEDPCGQNRSNLVFCVNLLLGCVKRCAWPEDPERATRGGFVVALTELGNPVCRNPAAPHVVPLLPHVLSLLKIFNELFVPEVQNIMNENYKECLTMPENEKANLLGLVGHASDSSDSQSNQNSLERIQRFLTGLYDSCYHMIGAMGPSLGRDLYSLPELGPAIINSVLSYLECVPDYRLRPVIRVFLKPFIHYCPPTFYDVILLPILIHIAPIMVTRLHNKWQQINELKAREATEENGDAQEVLEDILIRALTREYLDLLKVALVGGNLAPDTMETEELSMDGPPPPSTRMIMTSEVISDLGTILLRSEKTCQSIVLAVLGALSWIDSNASLKATLLTGPIVRLLIADNSLNGAMAAHVMAAVLHALALHGQHEANQGSLLTLGTQMYEILRPVFPEVVVVMQQIPGINPVDLQKLDERISGTTTKGNKVEKVKKDLFKKITGTLVGRSVGQLFKKEVRIADLPRLNFSKKEERKEVISDLRNLFSA